MKVSVIDLGFNSIKLVNYDVKKNGTFKAYQQEGVKVKLGEGLNHSTGYLSGAPVQRTIDALKMFRDIIDFDSIDLEPVKFIFLIVGKESLLNAHIKLLSRISRLMNKDEFRDKLALAKSPQDVLKLFREEEQLYFDT